MQRYKSRSAILRPVVPIPALRTMVNPRKLHTTLFKPEHGRLVIYAVVVMGSRTYDLHSIYHSYETDV